MLETIPIIIKFVISILWDAADFTIGRIPGFGTIFDMVGTLLAILLWGTWGLAAFWEIVGDPSDQLDAEIPTLTLIGIVTLITAGGKK